MPKKRFDDRRKDDRNDFDDRMSGDMQQRNSGGRRFQDDSFQNRHHGSKFQSGGIKGRSRHNRRRGLDNKLSHLLQDEDIEMSSNARYGQSDQKRGRGDKNRNQNYNKGRKPFLTLQESFSHWYKVTIIRGQAYDKDTILKLLQYHIQPTQLNPINYTVDDQCSYFLVDNFETADKLYKSDKRITLVDGVKLFVKVKSYTPLVKTDSSEFQNAVRTAMANRYTSVNKALDISKFHTDPVFTNQGILIPVNSFAVFKVIMDIIVESIPDLVALNISHNKIITLDCMKGAVEKLQYLKILHMSHNRLRDVRALDAIKCLNLEEIQIDGNSLCSKFKSQEEYIRCNVHKGLDGINLPPPITFDTGEETKLPPFLSSYMSEKGMPIAKAFLEEYFKLYDSNDRSSLLAAYHEDAVFSYDCFIPPCTNSPLGHYLQDNRNIIKVQNRDRRTKLLKCGRLTVVEYIKNFPKTSHNPLSFIVDLPLFTPQLIQLNVCGQFIERERPSTPTRYFSRVFLIIPAGHGFSIVNEQMTILPASPTQLKEVFKAKKVASTTTTASPVQEQPKVQQDEIAIKFEMVNQLALKSGMNLPWSEKCLNETSWNFDQALQAFSQLHAMGKIPIEAFQK